MQISLVLVVLLCDLLLILQNLLSLLWRKMLSLIPGERDGITIFELLKFPRRNFLRCMFGTLIDCSVCLSVVCYSHRGEDVACY